MSTPLAFLSYAWDSEDHKNWVLSLADGLVKNGVDVLFDQYDLAAGNEMTYFMEKAMAADKILVVMTPGYKSKADNREGGVGYEYSLFTKEFYEREPDKSRIIPVLRSGDKNISCPTFIQTKIFHDMRDDNLFDAKFFELIKLITNRPLIVKPPLGKLPDFENEIPEVEKVILDYQLKENFHKKKASLLFSEEGVALFTNTIDSIIEQISETLENYKNNFNVGFHIKKHYSSREILFSTINFTFFVGTDHLYSNSATEAKLIMNFFKGPIGLDGGIFYDGPKAVIYKTTYKFDVDSNFQPIFVRTDNENIVLTPHDVATIAVREVIVNEMKLRESNLR